MDLNEKSPRRVLPPDAAREDLHQPEYGAPLRRAAEPMVEQLRRLCDAIRRAGFIGSSALDCTLNGAQFLIDDFFRVLGTYEKGRVPYWEADELVRETSRLIALETEKYGDTCLSEINAMRQAFDRSRVVWARDKCDPAEDHAVYLRELAAAKEKILDAIQAFAQKLLMVEAEAHRRNAAGARKGKNAKKRTRAVQGQLTPWRF